MAMHVSLTLTSLQTNTRDIVTDKAFELKVNLRRSYLNLKYCLYIDFIQNGEYLSSLTC